MGCMTARHPDTPLGREGAEYLRHKTKRLTPASQRSYGATLRWLALDYPDMLPAELEPPAGTFTLENFLDAQGSP